MCWQFILSFFYKLASLIGCVAAVGHTRYATMGIKDAINCVQPFVMYTANGLLAVAHNGELINNKELRRKVSEIVYSLFNFQNFFFR